MNRNDTALKTKSDISPEDERRKPWAKSNLQIIQVIDDTDNNERKKGRLAAEALAGHLDRMGALGAELPVALSDGDYLVKITRHPKGFLDISDR